MPMELFALGNVQPQSTTIGLPATQNAPQLLNQSVNAVLTCRAIQFQVLGTNTGSIFICDRATPDLTKNVYMEIPPPGASPVTRPAWVIADPVVRTPFNAAQIFIVPANSGEGVRVTAVREQTMFAGGGATVAGALSTLILLFGKILEALLFWPKSHWK